MSDLQGRVEVLTDELAQAVATRDAALSESASLKVKPPCCDPRAVVVVCESRSCGVFAIV